MSDDALFALWRSAALARHPRQHWKYARRLGRLPDVALPRRYSERMLWRKLFDRDPLFVTFADKLATKDWIAARCPGLAAPRTLWRGTDPAAIPPELLRPGVIVKANHGCNFNLPIRDRVPPHAEVVATARRWLATTWGRHRGEWHYARVPRQVFVEEMVGDGAVVDIQVRAGGGRAGLCSVTFDTKTERQTLRYLDSEGNRITDRNFGPHAAPDRLPTPPAFPAAVAAARVLSRELDYARFDFLADGRRLWAGEITLFPAAGYTELDGEALRLVLGVWDLRNSWFLREGAARAGGLASRYAEALRRACDAGAFDA
jgi:hypothetical protein